MWACNDQYYASRLVSSQGIMKIVTLIFLDVIDLINGQLVYSFFYLLLFYFIFIAYWALNVHTTCSDHDQIFRSQQC